MSDMLDSLAPDVDLTKELPNEAEVPVEAPAPAQAAAVEAPKVVAAVEEAPKLVDIRALHESRQKEREWRDKALQIEKEAQAKFQALETKLNLLQNPPPAVPKFEEDPAANLQHQVLATKAELETLKQEALQTRQQREAQVFEERLASDTRSAEAVFAKEHPDYQKAVEHLQGVAAKNLAMMGMTDVAQIQAQIRHDAMAMALKALQQGKNPADVAYQLALNYGYKTGVTASVTDAGSKITALQEGQKAAGMPDGGTTKVTVTLASLEAMDDDEFNKLVEDDTQWRKLVKQMS